MKFFFLIKEMPYRIYIIIFIIHDSVFIK